MLSWKRTWMAAAGFGILGLLWLWGPGGSGASEPEPGSGLRTAVFYTA